MRKIMVMVVVCLSSALVAQSAPANSDNKLQSQLSPFAGWLGNWRCDGKFVKSGKPISSTLRLSSSLQGRWIEVQQDDVPPNRFHAIEFWGYDESAGKFVATVFDNFNPASRVFEAKPPANGVVTWNREVSGAPISAEQFLFENAEQKLKITYQVRKDGAWSVGDVLTCTRQ